MSEDSDAWLFGAETVVRAAFRQNAHPQRFTGADIRNALGSIPTFTRLGLAKEPWV